MAMDTNQQDTEIIIPLSKGKQKVLTFNDDVLIIHAFVFVICVHKVHLTLIY